MALKDLIKSKSCRLEPDPRIRWFGKLPTYSDYYRSSADQEWVNEFHDWIVKGFSKYWLRAKGTELHAARLPLAGCVLRLPESQMTILASILDFGGDSSGKRPFPMCFYVGVPTARWSGPTSDTLDGAARAIRDLLALRREVASFLNAPGRFEVRFGGRELDLSGVDNDGRDTSWLASCQELPMADWLDGVKARMKVQDTATWFRLAQAFGESLTEMDDASFTPTLRFPLAPRLPLDAQIAGWLRWLESRVNLQNRVLSVILTSDARETPEAVTIIARDLVPDDFLLLTPLASELTFLDDISKVTPPEDGDTDAGTRREDPPAGSWADFVGVSLPAT